MSQYLRDEWTSDRGFPGGAVHGLAQTADGYLWIAAEKGLVRFDGVTFRLLEPRGATPTIGPTVLGVIPAPDGSLWARLRGVALLRYRNDTFENVLPAFGAPESVVTAMVRGRGDAILASTLDRGPQIYRNGRADAIAPRGTLPASSFVIAMAHMANGEVWLGTRGAGVLRVAEGRITQFTDGLPDPKVNSLLAMDDGTLWIGTDKGLARWTGSGVTTSGVPRLPDGVQVLAMIRDRRAHTWIAAGPNGLFRVDARGHVTRDEPRDGPGRNVSSALEDREGNIWIGSDRGIERWRDPIFTTFSPAHGLPRAAVGPLHVDDRGRAWFAPTTGGLCWIHDGTVGCIRDAGLDRDVVYSIAGSGDDLWVGRQRGGVTRLRRSGETWAPEPVGSAGPRLSGSIYAIALARDGALWTGTLNAGATRWDHGGVTTFDTGTGLPSNTVASIVERADGTVWFATPNGLAALRRGAWQTFATRDGLPADDINTLFEDRHGVLWIGTSHGLALRRDDRFRAWPKGPEALRSSILGIAEDQSGSLWVNTVDRVFRVERQALLAGDLSERHVHEYAHADGLLAGESMKRHRTLVADAAGRIWVASNRGIAVAQPLGREAAPPALVRIESVSVDGAPAERLDAIEISARSRRVALAYMGISLAVPERVRYRYRLDGFDSAWGDVTADRQAVFTNLNPGQYRFRVIASNSDGVWSDVEASLPFEVRPMFWQTRPFQAAAAAGVLGLAWGLYRLRVRQLANQLNVRFEERLAERTRIARELHDTLLQGFLSASMHLHVAVERLPPESPAVPAFRRTLDLIGRVIDEGRNAVRGLRSSGGEPNDLEHAFAGVQAELAADPSIGYRVIVEGRPRPLNPAVRDDVYRIGREGLVNAFRHSGATAVEIEIDYNPGELRLFVRDDGRGIDPQVLRTGVDGHWGIVGMKERAERVGGVLTIRSRAAAGTEIELRVPGRAAFEHQ